MDLVNLVDGYNCFPWEDSIRLLIIFGKFNSTHSTQPFHQVRRSLSTKKNTSRSYIFINRGIDDVRWCKELHHTVLNSLSLKSHVTSVHCSQKPRTSDAMSPTMLISTKSSWYLLDLLAFHLWITNYRKTRRTPSIFAIFLPSAFHLFLLLFLLLLFFFFFLFIS